MKANNGKGNTPLRDGWRTPSELFETLNKQYHFTFDCCSNGKSGSCSSLLKFWNEKHPTKFSKAIIRMLESNFLHIVNPYSIFLTYYI